MMIYNKFMDLRNQPQNDHFEDILEMIKVDQKGVAFQGETKPFR